MKLGKELLEFVEEEIDAADEAKAKEIIKERLLEIRKMRAILDKAELQLEDILSKSARRIVEEHQL